MHVLLLIEVFGTVLGLIWFMYWALKKQKEVIFHKKMDRSRITHFGRHLSVKYLTKMFGRYAPAILLFGEEEAIVAGARVSGRVAARYGTMGVGLNALGVHGITYIAMAAAILFEFYIIARRNKMVLHDFEAFGKMVLEIFVTFSMVGLITELVFLA